MKRQNKKGSVFNLHSVAEVSSLFMNWYWNALGTEAACRMKSTTISCLEPSRHLSDLVDHPLFTCWDKVVGSLALRVICIRLCSTVNFPYNKYFFLDGSRQLLVYIPIIHRDFRITHSSPPLIFLQSSEILGTFKTHWHTISIYKVQEVARPQQLRQLNV